MRRIQEEFGLSTVGVEPSYPMSGSTPGIVAASGEQLPFESQCFDVVLCECTLSLCENPEQVLREIRRVLGPNGWLILSDVCGKETQLVEAGPLRRLYPVHWMKDMLEKYGFQIDLEEDHTKDLITMAAQLIMDGKEQEICEVMQALGGKHCGYYLIIGQKRR